MAEHKLQYCGTGVVVIQSATFNSVTANLTNNAGRADTYLNGLTTDDLTEVHRFIFTDRAQLLVAQVSLLVLEKYLLVSLRARRMMYI